MKLVKKFALAVIFVSVLAVPTFASDLETPGKTSTPPPPPGSSTATTTTSETAGTTGNGTTTDESSQLFYDAYMAVLGLY